MTHRDLAGFVFIPFVLILLAVGIKRYELWSPLCNATIPWFCTAIAISVLVVGLTSLLSGSPPSAIPASRSALVIITVLAVVGAGLGVDATTYPASTHLLANIGEVIGLAVLLVGSFWLPRIRVGELPTSGSQPEHLVPPGSARGRSSARGLSRRRR